jgi:hypothetical protein
VEVEGRLPEVAYPEYSSIAAVVDKVFNRPNGDIPEPLLVLLLPVEGRVGLLRVSVEFTTR